jgi:hypothetical protein
MKLIVLKGRSNCGKSDTLNKVYRMVLEIGYENSGDITARILGNQNNNDRLDMLARNGHTIGFAMMGDYDREGGDVAGEHDYIQSLVRLLLDNSCDVIIAACNNDCTIALQEFMTLRAIIVEKRINETNSLNIQNLLNGIDAEIIFKLI